MATLMQQKRGTSAKWFAQNPVLAPGEIGYETDTGIIKIGNGSTQWNSLSPALGSEYLPKLGKAADSERLDGLDSSEFLRATGKAVDSDKLDGIDSTGFATAARATNIETAPYGKRLINQVAVGSGTFSNALFSTSVYMSDSTQWSSVSPERITLRRSGYYLVHSAIHFSTAIQRVFIEPRLNNVAVTAGVGNIMSSSAGEQGAYTGFLVPVTAGQYLTMVLYQDSGATQTISHASYASSFIDWIWLRDL